MDNKNLQELSDVISRAYIWAYDPSQNIGATSSFIKVNMLIKKEDFETFWKFVKIK